MAVSRVSHLRTAKLTMKPEPQKKRKKKKLKQTVQEEETQSRTTPTQFSFTITQVAVSQICRSVGFKAAESSALETLTLVSTKYLQELAQLAASYSHASNRTESNVFDLINALHDLYLIHSGFVGASTLQNSNICLLNSSVLKSLSRFVKNSDEIPFAKPVPRENGSSKGLVCYGNEMSSRGLSSHIPKWLPGFPDVSTYKECRESACRKGGHLWENSMSEVVQGSWSGGIREQSLSSDLARERGKVRFKIGVKEGIGNGVGGGGDGVGVDMRNGVCRRGKRVCWNANDGAEDESKSGLQREDVPKSIP